MDKLLYRIYAFAKYLWKSFHLHGIHSPFVYQLNQEVFKETTPYYCFDEIESIRAKLILTKKKIKVKDLGASKTSGRVDHRKISKIARTSLKPAPQAQLLFRLVYRFKPKTILELGTSLGLTTAYLAKANPKATVTTIEGSEQLAKIAKVNHQKLSISNITQITDSIEKALDSYLSSISVLDFVFFDGNHLRAASLSYFEKCLERASSESIFVFDDIYWSKEMELAWKEIREHPKVKVSIDLFHMGIVFFKADQAKENFTVYQ